MIRWPVDPPVVDKAVERHMHAYDPAYVHLRFDDTCPYCLENSLMSKIGREINALPGLAEVRQKLAEQLRSADA